MVEHCLAQSLEADPRQLVTFRVSNASEAPENGLWNQGGVGLYHFPYRAQCLSPKCSILDKPFILEIFVQLQRPEQEKIKLLLDKLQPFVVRSHDKTIQLLNCDGLLEGQPIGEQWRDCRERIVPLK